MITMKKIHSIFLISILAFAGSSSAMRPALFEEVIADLNTWFKRFAKEEIDPETGRHTTILCPAYDCNPRSDDQKIAEGLIALYPQEYQSVQRLCPAAKIPWKTLEAPFTEYAFFIGYILSENESYAETAAELYKTLIPYQNCIHNGLLSFVDGILIKYAFQEAGKLLKLHVCISEKSISSDPIQGYYLKGYTTLDAENINVLLDNGQAAPEEAPRLVSSFIGSHVTLDVRALAVLAGNATRLQQELIETSLETDAIIFLTVADRIEVAKKMLNRAYENACKEKVRSQRSKTRPSKGHPKPSKPLAAAPRTLFSMPPAVDDTPTSLKFSLRYPAHPAAPADPLPDAPRLKKYPNLEAAAQLRKDVEAEMLTPENWLSLGKSDARKIYEREAAPDGKVLQFLAFQKNSLFTYYQELIRPWEGILLNARLYNNGLVDGFSAAELTKKAHEGGASGAAADAEENYWKESASIANEIFTDLTTKLNRKESLTWPIPGDYGACPIKVLQDLEALLSAELETRLQRSEETTFDETAFWQGFTNGSETTDKQAMRLYLLLLQEKFDTNLALLSCVVGHLEGAAYKKLVLEKGVELIITPCSQQALQESFSRGRAAFHEGAQQIINAQQKAFADSTEQTDTHLRIDLMPLAFLAGARAGLHQFSSLHRALERVNATHPRHLHLTGRTTDCFAALGLDGTTAAEVVSDISEEERDTPALPGQKKKKRRNKKPSKKPSQKTLPVASPEASAPAGGGSGSSLAATAADESKAQWLTATGRLRRPNPERDKTAQPRMEILRRPHTKGAPSTARQPAPGGARKPGSVAAGSIIPAEVIQTVRIRVGDALFTLEEYIADLARSAVIDAMETPATPHVPAEYHDYYEEDGTEEYYADEEYDNSVYPYHTPMYGPPCALVLYNGDPHAEYSQRACRMGMDYYACALPMEVKRIRLQQAELVEACAIQELCKDNNNPAARFNLDISAAFLAGWRLAANADTAAKGSHA